MTDTRRLGPTQTASVKLASKDQNGQPEVVFVGRGEALPANLADGEVERLEKAGAFAPPPRPVTVTVPEAAAALTSFLPPEVTLAANDADGNPPGLPVYPAAPVSEVTEGGQSQGGQASTSNSDPLLKLTKDELVALATERGVDTDGSETKAELAEKLNAAGQ